MNTPGLLPERRVETLRIAEAARYDGCLPMAKKARGAKARQTKDRALAPVPARDWTIDFALAKMWLGLAAATFAAYLPAISGKFVWDDDAHLTRPALASIEGLWKIWFQLGTTQQYYPLLHSAFWFEHVLWGNTPVGYHVANILLHATAAFLLVLIVRRLALPGAMLAGFIFALHPVCVEAVAWISEQKSTLSGVFYLAAALAYLKFDDTRRRKTYAIALALFVLALLSKTVTATLPTALLVVLWWKRGRLEWRRDVRPLIAWVPLGAGAGLFTAWVESTYVGHAAGSYYALSFAQRVLLAGHAICFYAAKLVWPANLTFTYPRWKIDAGVWWQWLFPAAVVAVAAALLVLARRWRGPFAAFLYFGGTLFPVLGFLNVYPFRYSWVADHFQYLAALGLIVPAAWAITRLPLTATQARWGALALGMVLGVLTWRQCGMYADAETLYRTTIERNPASYMAHQNLGNILLQSGRLDTAVAEFRAALRIEPDNPEAHNSLGTALMQSPGGLAGAKAEFDAALRVRPDYAEAHNNLGSVLMQMPAGSDAGIAEFRAAIRLKPDSVEAHENLGLALAPMPEHRQEAITELETALRLDPNDKQARQALRRLRRR